MLQPKDQPEYQEPPFHEKDHWFSFKDSCVSVVERRPQFHLELKGHSLFFLHGRFGCATMWKPLCTRLSSHYRCISVDLPGFGRSYTIGERAFNLLDHVNLVTELTRQMTSESEKVVLIGHDLGGGIAQLCALHSPRKIAAMILINTACLTRSLPKLYLGLGGLMARKKLHQLLSEGGNLPLSDQTLIAFPWRKRTTRQSLIRALRAINESWPWHYEQLEWKRILKQIQNPVLLLWGQKDSMNPLDVAVEMMQKLPEAYFFTHRDAGHWPTLEQPDWVVSKIREFIFRTGFGAEVTEGLQKNAI